MSDATEVGSWDVVEAKISYLATKDELQKEIRGLGERVQALETRAESFATKEGLADLRTAISDESKKMLKWGLGILIGTSISLSALVFGISSLVSR